MEPARVDQRRELGQRTRARLLDAALDLLAEHGEDAVTLREVTDAAEANVAAVSYHFGSLKSLFDAAIEHALERYLDAQREALNTLGPEPTLEELATAFARPMMRYLSAGGRDLAALRIVARTAIDSPPEWGRFKPWFDGIRAVVQPVLKRNVPGIKDRDLMFRERAVAGMLNWLALSPIGDELRNKSEKQIERLVVPIVAGALRGTTSG
jgi:AcrR family transcriptional regulator